METKKKMPTKRQLIYKRRRFTAAIFLAALIVTATIITVKCSVKENTQTFAPETHVTTETPAETEEFPEIKDVFRANFTSETKIFDSELVNAKYAILIDAEDGTVIAHTNGASRMYPASMTKVMTLIVAVENAKSQDSKFTMTYEIIKPLMDADASRAGFKEGEQVTVKDMLYGLILPSGADAADGIAECISGSEDEFVKLMNKKCEELGLHDTHFANTSGLHSEQNYSTAADMAVIMRDAMQNETCREVLSTYKYTTAHTEQNPEGIELESTMFSRMYGTEVEGVSIFAGKTGYTVEAGNCLVSCAEKDGKEYIAVVADSGSNYKTIYDTFAIYENYLPSSDNPEETTTNDIVTLSTSSGAKKVVE